VPKNACYFKKVVKSVASVGRSAPESPVGLRRLEDPPPDPHVASTACCCSTLSSSFLTLKHFITIEKNYVTTTAVLLLHLFFT